MFAVRDFVHRFVFRGSKRSVRAKKNILLSFVNKGISIIVSLLLMSTTIDYLDSVNYGIWITISSVVSWAGYFDLGFGHGFRNKFAIAKAKGDMRLAKQYVSTTYFFITLLFLGVFVVFSVVDFFCRWNEFLNLDISNSLLQETFFVLIAFFSCQSVLNIVSVLLSADQKPAFSSVLYTIGQICALAGIQILKCSNNEGSILLLSYILSGIPCLVYLIISVTLYSSRNFYKDVAPSIKGIRLNLVKGIFSLGGKFFLVQLSMLFIFQCTNVIVTKNLGPEYATEYNVAYRYFGVVFMIASIVLSPFWSAFTEAYERKDFVWMNAVYRKLSKLWWFALIGIVLMIVFSKWVYRIWLGGAVEVPLSVSIGMGLYVAAMTRGAVYMYLINGIGKVIIQMWIYVGFALISIPLLVYSCKSIGILGPIFVGFLVYAVQCVFGHKQLGLILSNRAKGLWNV